MEHNTHRNKILLFKLNVQKVLSFVTVLCKYSTVHTVLVHVLHTCKCKCTVQYIHVLNSIKVTNCYKLLKRLFIGEYFDSYMKKNTTLSRSGVTPRARIVQETNVRNLRDALVCFVRIGANKPHRSIFSTAQSVLPTFLLRFLQGLSDKF